MSIAANAFTGAVMICRKILMHVSVEKGAEHDKKFMYYIEHLDDKGYVPPDGKEWVDYIRKRSNEANHKIVLMNDKDANGLIYFVEKLLEYIYKLPKMVPKQESGK